MDILLLNLANLVDEQGEREYLVKQIAVPPLGVLYLGQVLSDNGYSVKVYDQAVTGEKNTELMKLIQKLNPKIVGFSVLLDNLWTTADLLKRLKAWNPNIVTIAGNYFATFFPEKLMKELDFDYCIRGEGEYILLNLVNHLFKKKQNVKEIKGLTFRENNIIKSTPAADKIKNLDELPIPDRKLIDFNYHLQHKSTSILSSRGCPFKCRFCFFSAVLGKEWRPRSASNVIEEIKLLKDQGFKDILFVDDNFTLNKKRTFKICAEIKRNQLDDINFSGDCRIDNAAYDMLRALVSINYKKVVFGIESGTQRILDYYMKGITINQIEQAIKTAKKARMEIIYGSFVLGAPDETFAEAAATVKFANKLDLSFVVFQILETIPITSIYQELIERELYTPNDDDWKKSLQVSDICPTSVPTKVISKLINEGFVRFFNKRYLIKLIFDALKNDYYVDIIIQSIKNFKRGIV
ncbi:MAG: cobalamin B12-binding domain-containing protein [Candidatus Helarchaeota archaeon]|nr:cobalamin B12-binding domain-containing protein [Candidatus Helarchaeota archaeon]